VGWQRWISGTTSMPSKQVLRRRIGLPFRGIRGPLSTAPEEWLPTGSPYALPDEGALTRGVLYLCLVLGLRGGGRTYYGTQSATYAPQWNTVGREERIFSGARQRIFSAEGPPRRGVVSGLGQEVLLLITGARELGNERPTPCPTESAASPPPPRRICGDPATWIARGVKHAILGTGRGAGALLVATRAGDWGTRPPPFFSARWPRARGPRCSPGIRGISRRKGHKHASFCLKKKTRGAAFLRCCGWV
jgi:hypothetical protein